MQNKKTRSGSCTAAIWVTKNRSPIRAVCQHRGFFLQTAERKRILPTLSAVWAFCCADTAPKAETILFHTMPQYLVESSCCIGERQITAALPYLQGAVFAYPSSHRKYCSRLCYGKHRKEWHMEKEHYHKIITYQTTVSILKSWMRAGLVTPEEFQKSTP